MKEHETSDNLIHWDCTLKSDAQRELLFFCYRSRVANTRVLLSVITISGIKIHLVSTLSVHVFGELASVMFQAFP